ncbi:MAG TPA: hypothetical protein VHT97_15500 [Acidimicrobiales bacterium]|nr:hypothetical protein [Acidimicrobiales bacterium]
MVALGALLGGGVGVFLATSGVGVPSKTKFLTKADAICRPANAPVASIAKPTNYPELASASGAVVTAADAELVQLHKVKLPAGGGGSQANGVITALASTRAAAQTLHDAAGHTDDAATAAATTQLAAQFADAGSKAKAYGFTACATGMQAGMDNLVGGTKALIKTGFMAKADNLCREGARNLDAIPEPKTDNRDLARAYGQVAAVTGKLLTDLKALPVAPGDEATVADMFDAQDKVNAKFAEMRDAASANDRQRFLAASSEQAPLVTAADSKFDAYGLGICGSNFGS